MPTRLVTMFGLGNPKKPDTAGYDPVAYRVDGRTAARTPLVSRAICELLAPVDSVVVLGTAEVARERHTPGAIARFLERPYRFVEIPKGSTEAERWRLFASIRDALSREALAGESAAPDRILFDVTHGFRTQPLFAMAVLSYVESEWARDRVTAPELRVLYGAYEPQPDVEAPTGELWDLTQQLTVSRWNRALDGLQRYGRADDLAELARESSRAATRDAIAQGESGAALRRHSVVKRFGAVAQRLADDLALARFTSTAAATWTAQKKSLRGSARALLEFLDDEAVNLREQLPVLDDTLRRLRAWAEPLVIPRYVGRDVLFAHAELALRYGQLQRYSEQIAAVREGLVFLFAAETGRLPTVSPGEPGFFAAFKPLEETLSRLARPGASPDAELRAEGLPVTPVLVDTVALFSRTVDPRNDIHHGGLRDQPLDADTLRAQLDAVAQEFATLARQ